MLDDGQTVILEIQFQEQTTATDRIDHGDVAASFTVSHHTNLISYG
jgi:hypothetical protein